MAPMELPGVMMTSPTWKTTRTHSRWTGPGLPVAPNRLGFTLLELLLAISLMGLMLGLSLPRVGAVKNAYFATEEAKAVANSVRSARGTAIACRTTVALTADSDLENALDEHRLEPGSWHAGDSAGLAAGGQDWQSVWEAPVARTTAVSGRVRVESGEPGILFFANGTSSGGEIVIEDEDGRVQHHFRVEPSTGELYGQ